jgi:hypothetical protein
MSDESSTDPTRSSPHPSPSTPTTASTPDPTAGSGPSPARPADGTAGPATPTEATTRDATAPVAKPGQAADKAADGKAADGKAADGKAADGKTADGKTADGKTADGRTADGTTADGKGDEKTAGKGDAPRERRRSLVTTLLSVFVVLIVVTAFGYFGGLGPLGRLSQQRALHAPDLLGGLARITDQEIRTRLELDQAAEALAQNNKGETSVEAYGDVATDTGLFVVIALRGKIDVNRTVADSGATADQVQKIGEDTCTTQTDGIVTCYRTSNTLTVMVRNSTGKAGVDRVAPMTDEAFNAFK